MESEMLPDDLEPALDADEAMLSAQAGAAAAEAIVARNRARRRMEMVFM
jgi:hypothetical protein